MRKKIKQLMNKEEGFTLVELLAVIVILGIILAIAIPSIGGIINRAQGNADSAEQDLAIEAARMYVIAENDSIEFGTTSKQHAVSMTDLERKGYFEFRETDGDDATVVVPGGVIITINEPASADSDEVATYSYEYTDANTTTGSVSGT